MGTYCVMARCNGKRMDSDDFLDIPKKDRKKLAKTIAEIKIPEARKGDKK